MRKLPPYLEFKLQQVAIFGLTILVACGSDCRIPAGTRVINSAKELAIA
jgi:hypothetical protein